MKKLSFFLMAMLMSVMSFAETYTHTFAKGEMKTGSVTLSGVTWNTVANPSTTAYNWDGQATAKGIQIGTSKAPCTSYTFTTSHFADYMVTNITVNASTASDGTAKMQVSVGGVDYIAQTALTTSATDYTGAGSSSGDVVISFTNTAKAFYIKSISITYQAVSADEGMILVDQFNVDFGKVTKTKTIVVTGQNLTSAITTSLKEGANFTVTGNLTAEGGELTVNYIATEAGKHTDVLVLTSDDVTTEVALAGEVVVLEGAGTKENPYTVADVIALGLTDKTQAWVEGYIIGTMKDNALEETPSQYSNIVLAAAADVKENYVPVALASGTNPRAALNVVDNPTMLGAKVAVYGTLETYFSKPGVKNVSDYVILTAPVAKYTVTVTATAEGENVVSGGGEYEDGEEVKVTASEDLEGWVFIGWTEDGEFVANDPEYTFDVKGDVELVAVYAADLGEKEVTDLVIDGENQLLTGSVADFEMGTMNLELALGEYDEEEGTFLLTEESKLYVGETNFTFVDGMAAVDMNTNSAMAIVVFELDEAYYHMTVNMSKKIEATVIEIDNATVTIEERSLGFGDAVYHVLKMESTWSDGETTYPVLLETTEFDQTKESQEVAATITVGGMGDEDPWLGSAEGDVTITVADGVVTVEGLLENAYAWPAPIAFDLTISGTLPVEKIAYELNGGAFPEVKVPTNAELWEAFKPYYNEYYLANGKLTTPRADQPIDKVSTFASAYMQQIMTDEASEYKWLGDYVLSVATAAGVTLSTDMASANESGWRWAVHAFFNAAAGQYGAAGIDFTEAGKPEAWGAAYLAEYGVVLPTEPVDAPYTLPTPVKEGYKFVGWYDNAEGTGEAYTVIPADWSGTLYAIWEAEGPATALDNIAVEGKVVKTIINGQLIIIKNGVQYNAQGAVIK